MQFFYLLYPTDINVAAASSSWDKISCKMFDFMVSVLVVVVASNPLSSEIFSQNSCGRLTHDPFGWKPTVYFALSVGVSPYPLSQLEIQYKFISSSLQ